MRKNLRSLAKRAFYALVPKRSQPNMRVLWQSCIGFPLIIRGFLRGRKLEVSETAAASASSPLVTSVADSQNPLETYFDAHTEGRGIWKWKHYFEIYHRHFCKFIGQEVRILEVGVYSGGSLEMWRHYFGPKCIVYGVDIEEACKAYEDDSIKIHIGDQEDRSFWKQFKMDVPAIDIIVDDGGHMAHQQIVTLEEMFPHLRPGGVYLCEDVCGKFNPFHAYVDGLTRNLHTGANLPTSFQRIVHSVHLYPFVIVLERLMTPVSEFVAPKQGTLWQPFL